MSGPGSSATPFRSCNACRRRKSRCDRVLPMCGQCCRSHLQCQYESSTPGNRDIRFIAYDAPPAQGSARGAISADELAWEQPAEMIAIPVDQLKSLESKVENLIKLVERLKDARISAPVSETQDSRPYQTEEQILDGHLSHRPSGSVRYVERTFWAYVCQEASQLDELLHDFPVHEPQMSESDEGISDSMPKVGSFISTYYNGDIFSAPPSKVLQIRTTDRMRQFLPRLKELLPSTEHCQHLVEIYFSGYHPIAPLFDLCQFMKMYARLFQQLDEENFYEDSVIEFVPLFVATLYAGAAICPPEELATDIVRSGGDGLVADLHQLTTKILRLANFPRLPTVASLTAYVQCQSTWMREEEPINCSAFVGLVVRVAYQLGLHRDPATLLSSNETEVHTRRLLWWHLVHIDVDVSIASGLPPIIDLSVSDVKSLDGPVQNLSNDHGQLNKEAVHRLVLCGKIEEVVAMRKMLRLLLERKDLTEVSISNIMDILQSLDKALSEKISMLQSIELASIAQGLPAESSSEERQVATFVAWSVDYLTVLKLRTWTIVYPALLSRSSGRDDRIKFEIVARALEVIWRIIRMSCSPEFKCFYWSWPGNHQALHAVMIVLMSLVENDETANTQIVMQTVEAIFALYQPHEGLVGGHERPLLARPLTAGGQNAWDFLCRLREQVWRKYGQDPTVIWSRREALHFASESLDGSKGLATVDEGTSLWMSQSNSQSPGYSDLLLDIDEWLNFDFDSSGH